MKARASFEIGDLSHDGAVYYAIKNKLIANLKGKMAIHVF